MATFTLDTSKLGGADSYLYQETIVEGRGRGVQLAWTQTDIGMDFEHLGFAVRFAAAEPEAKDTSA